MAGNWKISSRTKVATLLLMYPDSLEVLIGFDPHLASLRSALKRRLIAPRLSLADIAYESGTPVEEIVETLSKVLGSVADAS